MTAKKKAAKSKRVQRKKALAAGQAILYLHVDRSTKAWLKAACKKQTGHVSQSTMVERILIAAKKNSRFLNAAM